MGQYKLSVFFEWFIGFGIQFERILDNKAFLIRIPFVCFYIALEKDASGISVFGKEFFMYSSK